MPFTRSALRGVLGLLSVAGLAGCNARPDSPAVRAPDATPEAYRRSVAALMWPGATRAFQVTPEGDLYNGVWWVRVSGWADADSSVAPRRIAYEDRWCPVVRWSRASGDVRWEYEAVAAPDDEPHTLSRRGAVARAFAAAACRAAAPRGADGWRRLGRSPTQRPASERRTEPPEGILKARRAGACAPARRVK